MKKLIVMLLAVLMLLGLCACGGEAPAEENTQIEAQPKVEATAPIEETTAEVEETTVQEETAAAADPAADKKALAESCIDKDISELYALIGEPESSDYAPSCLEEGGEDGSLYYDGFVVYTLRVGDVETVFYVE